MFCNLIWVYRSGSLKVRVNYHIMWLQNMSVLQLIMFNKRALKISSQNVIYIYIYLLDPFYHLKIIHREDRPSVPLIHISGYKYHYNTLNHIYTHIDIHVLTVSHLFQQNARIHTSCGNNRLSSEFTMGDLVWKNSPHLHKHTQTYG